MGGVAATIAVAGTVALSSPAQAELVCDEPPYWCVYHGRDYAYMNDNERWVVVGNLENDDRGVYAQVRYRHPQAGYLTMTVWASEGLEDVPGETLQVRVCEDGGTCTDYKSNPYY